MKTDYKNLDVFVLTYNRAEYLRIMLDSLCTQTATGFNIKILNNCSTDNTLEVIDEVRNKYPERNIEVITNEKNLGNFGNFKRSQKLANNEYTAIFHDDDAIHPEYIETAMNIFKTNPDTVMCTSSAKALYNVSNTDWDILYKDFYKYKKNKGTYFQFIINRPNFASNIYKTDVYKKIVYNTERYGKLHDIMFQFDINKYGAICYILGIGIRWRQSAQNDSNNFKNGPFPNEVANVINDIYNNSPKKRFLLKTLTYNFAYFLYKWSLLKNYETWYEFRNRLLRNVKGGGIFSPLELMLFQQKWFIDCFNKLIIKRANYYRKKVYKQNDTRF